MSDNWIVQNLQNALDTWNKYLSEIWQLITQSPEQFKGGSIWSVIVNIHDAVRAIGLALLVLFFVIGIVKTCGSFAEVKKPEHALKLFIRFAIAKGVVTYGLELMMALFNIVQGLVSTIMNAAGFGTAQQTVLPQEIVTAVESCGFFESIISLSFMSWGLPRKHGPTSARCLILSRTVSNRRVCTAAGRPAAPSAYAVWPLTFGTAIPSRNTATPIPRKICSAASLPPISWRA